MDQHKNSTKSARISKPITKFTLHIDVHNIFELVMLIIETTFVVLYSEFDTDQQRNRFQSSTSTTRIFKLILQKFVVIDIEQLVTLMIPVEKYGLFIETI